MHDVALEYASAFSWRPQQRAVNNPLILLEMKDDSKSLPVCLSILFPPIVTHDFLLFVVDYPT